MTFRRKTSSEVTNENKEHFQDKLKHLGSSIFITLLYDFKKKNFLSENEITGISKYQDISEFNDFELKES